MVSTLFPALWLRSRAMLALLFSSLLIFVFLILFHRVDIATTIDLESWSLVSFYPKVFLIWNWYRVLCEVVCYPGYMQRYRMLYAYPKSCIE